jgi:protein MAK11
VATCGKLVASGGADDRLCLYDLEKRQAIDEFYVHDGTVNCLEFVVDGSYLISCGADGKIAFIKTSNWKVEKMFEKAHKGTNVSYISCHPSGKLALSVGNDMILRTWNLINGRQAFATSLKNKSFGTSINFVKWSLNGDYFLLSGNNVVEIWSTEKAEVIASKLCESKPTAVCWISDSDVLVGMENGKLLFFNWEDEDEEATLCEIYDNRIKCMKYVDGFLITASSSGELNLWKVIMGDQVEIDMVCGIEIGCRIICVDIIDLVKAGIEKELKIESDLLDESLKKSQVKSFNTKASLVIEVDEDDNHDKDGATNKKKSLNKSPNTPVTSSDKKKRQSSSNTNQINSSKKSKRLSTKLKNGFVEEDN